MKHGLEDMAQSIFSFAQGLGDLLKQPTLHVFMNFGSDLMADLLNQPTHTNPKGRQIPSYTSAADSNQDLANNVEPTTKIVLIVLTQTQLPNWK